MIRGNLKQAIKQLYFVLFILFGQINRKKESKTASEVSN